MRPPQWTDVPALMHEWISDASWGSAARTRASIAEALADLHARFEQIHPFLDGNGRAGRLVLNLLFVRLGIPPAIIYRGIRSRYLDALRRADTVTRVRWGEFLARAVLDNLYKFVVPAVAGPARMVPLPAPGDAGIVGQCVASSGHRGRLKAAKAADGSWRSSNAWVDEYRATRYKRDG